MGTELTHHGTHDGEPSSLASDNTTDNTGGLVCRSSVLWVSFACVWCVSDWPNYAYPHEAKHRMYMGMLAMGECMSIVSAHAFCFCIPLSHKSWIAHSGMCTLHGMAHVHGVLQVLAMCHSIRLAQQNMTETRMPSGSYL